MAQECHISVGSCDETLRKDVNMRRVFAKFVPRLLTEDQQFQRLTTSSDFFQSASDDPDFTKFIITGDESWVYGYDPETKQRSSQWKTPGSPRPKKARAIQVMSIVFLDASGVRSPGPDSEQRILLERREEIKRGCSQKTTGVVGVLSLDSSP
ncbi:uncharacterized protein TNCV_837251 [Trichonephila clavipes]|nr:uncharacterized protein TNCV_837251 [Trichonephila clavipes]